MESEDVATVCRECGSTRTKQWNDLDEGERLVASRKAGLPDGERPKADRFCARCLTPSEDDGQKLA